MNPADVAIAVIVAISVVIGLVRGLVVEVLSLAVWIAAVMLAIALGPQVAEWFGGSIELPSARVALGYAIVFFTVLIAGAIVVYLMRKLVKGTGLSGTDRVLGMVFGLARGAIVVVVLVLLVGFTPLPRDPWWQESRALPLFQALAHAMARMLPASLSRYVEYGLAAGRVEAAAPKPPVDAPADPAPEPATPKDLQ
ncbi:MAG TPA: CvpA family protein [Candidatus Saccharimonadia bacterium]|nr:CvpA family protein [Candidatus Saccharimonadia bacterium]